MDAAIERVTLYIPKEDIQIFKTVAQSFGWKVSNECDALVDEFIDMLPTEPLLSEEKNLGRSRRCKARTYVTAHQYLLTRRLTLSNLGSRRKERQTEFANQTIHRNHRLPNIQQIRKNTMMSFEDAIRCHVHSLQIKGELAIRDDDLESQLKRIEESVQIMNNYGMNIDYYGIMESVGMLKNIENVINDCVNFTSFEDIIEQMEEAINNEIQNIFDDYPEVQSTVYLMRAFELAAK